MARMREWDIYEAAVLLDAYLKVRSGGLTKQKAIEQVSCALMKMATNNGSVIDDVYRNENGISFQFQRMDSAFSGKTIILPSTKLFNEVVNLYTNSRERFDAILSDAFIMINPKKTNTDAFKEWLSKNYPKQSWESIVKDLQTAEEYCRKKLILKAALLETTDPIIVKRVFTAVESDKIFRFTYKNRRNDIHKAVSLYYRFVKGIAASTQSDTTAKPTRGTVPEVVSGEVFTEPVDTAPDIDTAVPSTDSDSHNASDDPVLQYLEANNIEYVDLRAKQGCLWIIGGMKIDHILNPLRIAGMVLVYKREGGTATGGREAFWTKDSSEKFSTKGQAAPSSAIREQQTAHPAVEPSAKSSKTDERLRRKYPDEYKLIRKTLYELTHESDKGITLNEFQDALKLAVSYFVSHDILSNAPWSEKSGTSLYGMPMFRYIGEYSEESDDSKAASEQQDYIKESLCQTIEYLKTRYSVRLSYDHFENPTTRSNDMLYKAKNDRKDIMWIYYIHTRASHYVSVETEPEYLESIGHELYGFTNIIDRYSHPCKKMIFDDYEAIRDSLVEICDAIDAYFAGEKPQPKEDEEQENVTGPNPPVIVLDPKPPVVVNPKPPISTVNHYAKKAESIVLEADLDGITVEALAVKMGIPVSTAKKVVLESMNIVSICDKLIHKDAFMDWDEGADKLEAVLDKLMSRNNGYVSDSQLYDFARIEMQMFLNDNDMDDKRKVFDLAEHLFSKECHHGKRYTFWMKTHISPVQDTITSKLDVMRKYARDEGGFFREYDLENYLKSLGIKTANLRQQMRVYDEPIFLFYEPGVFITTESMGVDEAWLNRTAQALSKLFADVGDHIVLRDIQPWWYNLLSELPGNRPWTPLLLQSVLMHYGKKVGARTIIALAGQNCDTLNAMLVSLNSEIQTFADAVIALLIEEHIEQRRFEAEELRHLLARRGMISGNELIWNMPKALPNDGRFAWDADGQNVTINI